MTSPREGFGSDGGWWLETADDRTVLLQRTLLIDYADQASRLTDGRA
jgi:hypothetical protein